MSRARGPTPVDPKGALRAQIRLALARLSPADRAARSTRICEHLGRRLLENPALANGPIGGPGAVMAFGPMSDEPDVLALVALLMSRGVVVAMPRVDWDRSAMRPAAITSLLTDLVRGRHGVAVPAEHCAEVPMESLVAVIVPGVAFDHRGHRLGRGGGFYDRFLAELSVASPKAVTIGVAFEVQRVPSVPTGVHDRRVAMLCTESGVSRCLP